MSQSIGKHNIKMDLEVTEWEVEWFHLVQGRDNWRTLANTVMILRVSQNPEIV